MPDVRLIEANALEQEIINEYITDKNPSGILTRKGEEIFNAAIDVARCRVRDAETIDAVPVVHGQWLRENIRPKSYLRVCSMCKKTAYFCGEGCSYKYCPNCGAKMDAKDTNVPTKTDKED